MVSYEYRFFRAVVIFAGIFEDKILLVSLVKHIFKKHFLEFQFQSAEVSFYYELVYSLLSLGFRSRFQGIHILVYLHHVFSLLLRKP